MMDGEDVYQARLAACLAATEAATFLQVRERHLAAARSWQSLLDGLLVPTFNPSVSAADDGN